MSTHTPGPWTWFDYPDGRKLLAAPSRAVVHCPDAAIACDPADAHLIAAAPDLLAALKALVAGVERDDNPRDEGHCEHSDEMNAARVAISKAEGKGQAA